MAKLFFAKNDQKSKYKNIEIVNLLSKIQNNLKQLEIIENLKKQGNQDFINQKINIHSPKFELFYKFFENLAKNKLSKELEIKNNQISTAGFIPEDKKNGFIVANPRSGKNNQRK
jgi:hypothetical protein